VIPAGAGVPSYSELAIIDPATDPKISLAINYNFVMIAQYLQD
jgi:hypothetical protein